MADLPEVGRQTRLKSAKIAKDVYS